MAAHPGLVAHGGVAGAIVEVSILLVVVGALVAVWLSERRGRAGDEAAVSDDAEMSPSKE